MEDNDNGIFCTECNDYCWTEIEQECKLCGKCADRMYERELFLQWLAENEDV